MLRTDLIAPLHVLLKRNADEHPQKVAYRDAKRSTTYGALAQTTANLAGHLSELGLKPGESVAIWLPNSVEWIEASFSITRAGGVGVPISYEATESEVLYRLEDAAYGILITTD